MGGGYEAGRASMIRFRIYGGTPDELYSKINGLLTQAKNKWLGIFAPDER